MTMQGVYRKWVGTPPPGLEASATVDALRAICELDLEEGADIVEADLEEAARSHPKVARYLAEGTWRAIVVPGRLVNFVPA